MAQFNLQVHVSCSVGFSGVEFRCWCSPSVRCPACLLTHQAKAAPQARPACWRKLRHAFCHACRPF